MRHKRVKTQNKKEFGTMKKYQLHISPETNKGKAK